MLPYEITVIISNMLVIVMFAMLVPNDTLFISTSNFVSKHFSVQRHVLHKIHLYIDTFLVIETVIEAKLALFSWWPSQLLYDETDELDFLLYPLVFFVS